MGQELSPSSHKPPTVRGRCPASRTRRAQHSSKKVRALELVTGPSGLAAVVIEIEGGGSMLSGALFVSGKRPPEEVSTAKGYRYTPIRTPTGKSIGCPAPIPLKLAAINGTVNKW